MKILYVHQYFKTPAEGGAIRSYHLARAMVAAGHEVKMIRAVNGAAAVEWIEGIEVYSLHVPYQNEMGSAARITAFVRFLWHAWQVMRSQQGVTLCYLSSTPLTVGLLGLWAKWRRKWPYVFEVRDLWPEAPIQMGAVPWKPVQQLLYWLEKRIYLGANAIVALSPGMVAGVKKVAPGSKVHLVPNMADLVFYSSLPDKSEAEEMLGWPPRFRLLYAGTIGRANQLEPMVRIAKAFPEQKAELVLVGDGAEKARLESLTAGWPQVRWMQPVSKDKIRLFHAASDGVLVSFGPQPVLETTSPNKLFDGLAAEKMVVVNVNGWLRDMVEKSGCGIFVNPDHPTGAVDKLRPYWEEPEKLAGAQAAARQLAEERFSVEALGARVVKVVEEVGNGR